MLALAVRFTCKVAAAAVLVLCAAFLMLYAMYHALRMRVLAPPTDRDEFEHGRRAARDRSPCTRARGARHAATTAARVPTPPAFRTRERPVEHSDCAPL